MVAFQHEFIRQGSEVDIVGVVPCADEGHEIFFAYGGGYIIAHLKLIHHHGVFIPAVMELQPLELFTECFRAVDIEMLTSVEAHIELDERPVIEQTPKA